jgi:homoserine acetyltransferase
LQQNHLRLVAQTRQIFEADKPLDTDKYCVIAGDGLINQAIKDGHTVTTGPASADPSTGKPYALPNLNSAETQFTGIV